MSLRVMIIPEDFRTDEYMLQPIIEAMFAFIGKQNAKIEVCQVPNFEGDGQALKVRRVKEVIDLYGMVDLFILCVDRDGNEDRRISLDNMEAKIEQDPKINRDFIAENAWQEIEAWILVGLENRPKGLTIAKIRAERDPKEAYFEPLAKERNLTGSLGGGRKAFADEAAKNYKKLRSRCPQDILNLETRIKELVS